jgi:integrase
VKGEIYDYKERLQRYRRIIKDLRNGKLALSFLDHLLTLGLSEARVSGYASHIPSILRVADFDLASVSRGDIEKVIAWINSQPYSESTKRSKKIALKKLVQYAKYGSCDRDTPYPKEVAWIKANAREGGSRTTPEALLSREDFEAMVKATDNARDRALVYTLFEGALRPGELLGMSVGSVEFKDNYCLITVNGKTGLKRISLVTWLERFRSISPPSTTAEEHTDIDYMLAVQQQLVGSSKEEEKLLRSPSPLS